VLDGILDPHNLGSIIRSAECAGAHGVIIGKRRSASVTAATVKASAGATEHVKIARVVNIPAAVEELKRAKLWVAGADMTGAAHGPSGSQRPLALVIGGARARALSKLSPKNAISSWPSRSMGRIGSLNAGVAAGILMFEKNGRTRWNEPYERRRTKRFSRCFATATRSRRKRFTRDTSRSSAARRARIF
jgi:23S rRNA (guanosine2251-2'-O)-methyltransferase